MQRPRLVYVHKSLSVYNSGLVAVSFHFLLNRSASAHFPQQSHHQSSSEVVEMGRDDWDMVTSAVVLPHS